MARPWLAACALQACALNAASAARALRAGASRSGDGSLGVYPPFDIDPASFLATLEGIPADVLVLFHSRTCPDCTKILPQWVQVARDLQDRKDLVLLTVADPQGLAPSPYEHDENPAVFFARLGRRGEPSALSMDDVHAFTYTQETPATEAAIRLAIEGLAGNQSAPRQAAPRPRAGAAAGAEAAAGAGLPDLSARLLAELARHEREGARAQLEVVRSKVYASLPLAQYLLRLGPQAAGSEPLAVLAARFLDGQAPPASAAPAR